jgi:hypothetical protein
MPATEDLYTLETIAVDRLPDVDVARIERYNAKGLAQAVALCQASPAPPIIVQRVVSKRRTVARPGPDCVATYTTLERLDVYDGLKRIAAARANGVATIEAAVCRTPSAAAKLRHRMHRAGGPLKFWPTQRAYCDSRSPTADP